MHTFMHTLNLYIINMYEVKNSKNSILSIIYTKNNISAQFHFHQHEMTVPNGIVRMIHCLCAVFIFLTKYETD
jgi:hypothetical protein